MPVQIVWDDEEKTMLRHIYQGEWTWQEFDVAVATAYTWIESVPHRVHIIVDLRQTGPLPANVLLHIRGLADRAHPRIGKTIIVGTNAFLQRLYDVFTSVYAIPHNHVILAPTLEEAHRQLSNASAPA